MEVQKYEKRLFIQQKLSNKNKQKQEVIKKWGEERERHKQLMAKVPVFEKLKYDHEMREQEEVALKKQIILKRRQNFLPIVTQEIHEFANKVDQIVGHLNQQRKEQRIESTKISIDLQALRSNSYDTVV
tara:strand:+ start:227 stop:613 length:387 start_codon:yes stop_codon:yes gene_type:complete